MRDPADERTAAAPREGAGVVDEPKGSKASPKDRAIATALRLLAGRVVFREEADVEAFTEAVNQVAPVEPPEPA